MDHMSARATTIRQFHCTSVRGIHLWAYSSCIERSFAWGCVMTVWVASPVAATPVVRLGRWRVYEAADARTRHFAGHNLDRDTGRVSSAITAYDAATHRGRTESGRVYELIGAPALQADVDAAYVWRAWCALNRVSAYVDVTHEYVDAPCAKFH